MLCKTVIITQRIKYSRLGIELELLCSCSDLVIKINIEINLGTAIMFLSRRSRVHVMFFRTEPEKNLSLPLDCPAKKVIAMSKICSNVIH